jgi:hypothetical protein
MVFIANLLSPQNVSGTIMPIIRSSRVIQMVAACDTWHFEVYRSLVWCGAVGYTSGLQDVDRLALSCRQSQSINI